MPVIRMAGSGGGFFQGAGQAAAAYNESTADTRRQIYRQREVQQQIAAADQRQLLALGQQAQYQAQQQANQDRNYQLDLRRTQAQEGRDLMRGVIPMSGRGLGMAFQQLGATDPAVAQQFMAEMRQKYPDLGDDATPEDFEAHPGFADIYASAQETLLQARTAQREQAMFANVQATERAFREDFSDVLTDDEIAQYEAELGVELSDPDLGPAEVAALTKQYRTKAAVEAGDRRRRNRAIKSAQELLESVPRDSAPMDLDGNSQWDQAARMIGDLRTDEDPEGLLADIQVLLDPNAAKIAERAYMRGTRQGAGGAAVLNVRGGLQESQTPTRADMGFDEASPRAQQVSQGAYGPPVPELGSASDPSAVAVDTPVGKALRPPVPESEAQFVAFLDRKGVALDDEAAITKAAEDWQALPARKASAQERREMAVLNRRIYGTDDTRAIVKRRAEAFKKHWERRGLADATPEEQQEFVAWFTSSIARQYEAEQAKIDGTRNAQTPEWLDAIYAAPGAAVRGLSSWIKGGEIDMSNVPAELLVGLE